MNTSRLAIFGGPPMVPPGGACRWPVPTEADQAAVGWVLERGVLSGLGAPESEFTVFVGARFRLATNSGTAALHLFHAAAGVGPGDEVIVPALSFIATAQAVLQQGAVPVFAEIDPRTYTLDPADAAARVTARSRAIVPVHLHGLPADMDAVIALAGRAGLIVIEDAAQAHRARYRGRSVGTLGQMAAFSLNSTKNLPAGEGGLFVTDKGEFRAWAARVRFNGLDPAPEWDPLRPLDGGVDSLGTTRGWMYLPGEITAALARAQLERLPAITARSQRNAARLTARLAELPGVYPPSVPSDRTHVFHRHRVRLDSARVGVGLSPRALRDLVLRALRAEGGGGHLAEHAAAVAPTLPAGARPRHASFAAPPDAAARPSGDLPAYVPGALLRGSLRARRYRPAARPSPGGAGSVLPGIRGPEDPDLAIESSGTSGHLSRIYLSPGELEYNARQGGLLYTLYDLGRGDRLLCTLDLAFGLGGLLVERGARYTNLFAMVVGRVDPLEAYRRLAEYRFNVVVSDTFWLVRLTEIARERGHPEAWQAWRERLVDIEFSFFAPGEFRRNQKLLRLVDERADGPPPWLDRLGRGQVLHYDSPRREIV